MIHNTVCMTLFRARSFQTSQTPSMPPLIHRLPNQFKSGSRRLGLFIHEMDLIALRAVSVHAA